MVIASEVLERALSEGPGDFKAGLALPVLYSIGEIQSLSVPPVSSLPVRKDSTTG